MTGGGRRNFWLRMTDWMGLTEAGKKPEPPGPNMLLFQVVLWFAMVSVWLVLVFITQGETQVLSGVLVVLSLVLAVGNFVMLRRVRRNADSAKVNGKSG